MHASKSRLPTTTPLGVLSTGATLKTAGKKCFQVVSKRLFIHLTLGYNCACIRFGFEIVAMQNLSVLSIFL